MSSASGLALAIRKAVESETFDLGGQTVSTITHTIQAAFAEPLPLREMIRITFVTGAGKQARQKYDEGAARAVTTTLRELGFDEDRAASCVVECAGTFKLQHDTGKNLKTVVVFPKIQVPQDGDGPVGTAKQTLVPADCPAGQIARSSPAVFKNMLKAKCPSWSQKKGCHAALEHLKEIVNELDAKFMKGTPLEEAEQDFYDNTSGLEEKMAHCKDAMHHQVESGGVTKFEKDVLLEQNADRLTALTEETKTAKGPKLEKLKNAIAKATQRKEMLANIEPKAPHQLKHAIEIARLWKEAAPLMQLQEKCKGRLLSVKETQSMARLEEVLQEIHSLEDASRGWFEDEDAFQARLKAIRAAYTSKLSQKQQPKKVSAASYAAALTGNITSSTSTARKTAVTSATTAASSSSPTRTDKFVTPGQGTKPNAWDATAKKKKKMGQAGGVFAAMMEEKDDSDYEEDEAHGTLLDEHDIALEKPVAASESPIQDDNSPLEKKGKKKKKKTKGSAKKKSEADMSEDELLAAATARNRAAKKAEEDAQEVSHPAIAFLKNYLIPFILGFIAFLVSLFFGKPKQKKR